VISLTKSKEITAAKLATLRPATRAKVAAWLDDCQAAGLLIYVYEGYRTPERQAELYAQGRTKPGKEVTKAGPWQSMHQYKLAIDFVPLKPHAKADGMFDADWDNTKAYAKAHALAVKRGLRKISWETPHLEDAAYRDWKHAKEVFGTK
jgi:peptidoglycan L-alanyl-D-glutamate endopeptidase CwlK